MCHCEIDLDCNCNCDFVKDFEGVYKGVGKVYYVNLETKEVYLVEEQTNLLEIKKIADKLYFITITELVPNPGLSFSIIANQTTENKYLIQSGGDGLNSYYFDVTEGFDVLNSSFTTPNTDGKSFGGSIKYIRQ